MTAKVRIRIWASLGSTAVIDPATGKIDRRIFSDQAVYDEEMEKIFGRAWLMIGHESLVPARRRLLPHLYGRGPGHPDPRRAGPAPRAAEHVPPPRQPRGALRRRQRQTFHVHLSRLDLSQRRHPRARPGRVRSLLRRARQSRPSVSSRPAWKPTRGSSSPPGPRTRRASRPIWATRAGISTPCSIGSTAACRRWVR